jgi:hypothetical protein
MVALESPNERAKTSRWEAFTLSTNPFLKYDSGSKYDSKWLPSLFRGYDFVTLFSEVSPLIFLLLLAFLSYKSITSTVDLRCIKWIITMGTMLSYILVATFWLSERNFAPRMVYGVGFGLLVLNFFLQYLGIFKRIQNLALSIVTAWSQTVLILLGKQGSFVALVCLFAGTVSLFIT